MAGNRLENVRVAALVTDEFEEIEFTSPRDAIQEEGGIVHLLAPAGREEWHVVRAVHHNNPAGRFEIDSTIEEANPEDYVAVILPGGALNADKLRTNEAARNFLRHINDDNKPIFVICHGAWTLISAGLVRGRRMTSYHSIKDDMVNAGAIWVDEPLVEDENIVSSRHPGDLVQFNRRLVDKLAELDVSAMHERARELMMGEE